MDNTPLTEKDWSDWPDYIANTFGIRIAATAAESFKTYLFELTEYNKNVNLISFRTSKEILYRHFGDSLAGAAVIKQLGGIPGVQIADIGSGAGFPGIPVCIASPYKNVTLIESVTKKTVFLALLKEKLALTSVSILNDRAENIAQDVKHRSKYDFVLSRAAARLSPNLELAIPLLKLGGYALIYKTENTASDEALAPAGNAMKTLGCEISGKFCYTIPDEELKYCVVSFKKVSATPDNYPRRAGIPEKKPL